MSSSDFLQYPIGKWEPSSLVLPLSVTPRGALKEVDLKEWFVNTNSNSVAIDKVRRVVGYAYTHMCIYVYMFT